MATNKHIGSQICIYVTLILHACIFGYCHTELFKRIQFFCYGNCLSCDSSKSTLTQCDGNPASIKAKSAHCVKQSCVFLWRLTLNFLIHFKTNSKTPKTNKHIGILICIYIKWNVSKWYIFLSCQKSLGYEVRIIMKIFYKLLTVNI